MNNNRLHYLDGLRGILAVIVFVHHYLYAFCPDVVFGGDYREFITTGWNMHKVIALTPVNILFNPGTAINFFFLLSGYVQTYSYFKNPGIVFLQKSFFKRYFRLALPTLAVVIIVFVFHRLDFFHKALVPDNPSTDSWVRAMLPDISSFFKALEYGLFDCFKRGSPNSYYQILWTMPVELYNSWLIILLLLVTHNLKKPMVIFVLVLLAQVFLFQAYYGVSFTLGMIICNLHVNSERFKKLFSGAVIKYSCLLLGLYFASYPFAGYKGSTAVSVYSPISFFDVYPHVISYITGNTLLFCVLLNAPRVKVLLTHKIFRFFGDISFMFYLTHFLILFSFSPCLYNMLLPIGRTADLVVTVLATFGLITLVSYLLSRWVDKPVIKLTNSYSKKLFAEPVN